MAEPYKPVPVATAREIAEKFDKSIVIILTHDPVHGLMHTTTYGTDPHNKAWAAQGGEIASKALGGVLDQSTQFEDYRLSTALELREALKTFMEMWGTRDAVSSSKRAENKRAEMWDKANAAIYKAKKVLG